MRGQRHLVLLGLSVYAAFSVSVTSVVSGFTRLWSYRGRRQIMAMERKELRNAEHTYYESKFNINPLATGDVYRRDMKVTSQIRYCL